MTSPDGASPDDRVTASTRVVLRPLATPLPLGFLALAISTAVFATLDLGWIPAVEGKNAGLIALGLTAPLQLVASVLGFLGRDPVAGTGVGIQAGTWALIGLITFRLPPGGTSSSLGVMLLISACAVFLSAAVGINKLAAAVTMALTGVRFGLTGGYELTSATGWKTAAGAFGLALAVVALYAAVALELEGRKLQTVLPVGRSSLARRSMEGEAAVDGDVLAREPGVRARL